MIKKFLFAAVCICSLSFVSQAQQALKFGTCLLYTSDAADEGLG